MNLPKYLYTIRNHIHRCEEGKTISENHPYELSVRCQTVDKSEFVMICLAEQFLRDGAYVNFAQHYKEVYLPAKLANWCKLHNIKIELYWIYPRGSVLLDDQLGCLLHLTEEQKLEFSLKF